MDRMKIRISLFVLLLMAGAGSLLAQQQWSLEQCIEYARQNNLDVKQSQYNVQLAELTERGSKLSRMPSLNASFNGSANYGRSINPTTNTFESEENFGGSGGLQANFLLYDGNRINNQVKQSKIDAQAARLDADAALNDISLSIAQAYLSILLAEEQLSNARQRIQLSELQLDQAQRQIEAGTLPENDRLDFLAQIALDQQTIIETENLVEINYLNLKQLMQIDPEVDFQIQSLAQITIPENAAPSAYMTDEVYQTALQTQPQIQASDLRIQSAELDARIARSGYLPQIALFANLNTRYNNLTIDRTRGDEIVNAVDNPVLIDGSPATLTFFQPSIENAPNMTFFDQMSNFFGQTFGFSIQVPIYNRHQNIIAVERAEVAALNQQVVNRQLRQQLKTDVQRAVTNARASERALEASRLSLEAAEAAFENAQSRYDLGAINSLEYTTARNNFDQADINYTRARYQYLFDLKVVDFYYGRELTLN